jgi:hypothetical protein
MSNKQKQDVLIYISLRTANSTVSTGLNSLDMARNMSSLVQNFLENDKRH